MRLTSVLLSVEEATAQGNTAETYRFEVRSDKSTEPHKSIPIANGACHLMVRDEQ